MNKNLNHRLMTAASNCVVAVLTMILVVGMPLARAQTESAPPGEGVAAWQERVNYAAGNRAVFDGQLFEVIEAHHSLLGWEPPNVPALWQVPAPDPEAQAEWLLQTAYVVGSEVTHDGTVFRAIQAHTAYAGYEPPSVPALWEPVASIAALDRNLDLLARIEPESLQTIIDLSETSSQALGDFNIQDIMDRARQLNRELTRYLDLEQAQKKSEYCEFT